VIWPWDRRRRARRAELAALGASVSDERLDPERILGAVDAEYEPLTGHRNGEDVQDWRARFGTAQVAVLLRLRPRWREPTLSTADPCEVTLRLGARADVRVVDFRVARGEAPAEAAVQVTARARSWVGKHGYFPARVLSGAGPYGGSEYPAARSRRLRALWIFELTDGWTFVRFESWSSGSYRYERALDTAAEDHREIRDELVLRDAAEDVAGLKIPMEIAESLPFDARAALLELSGIDESFELHVIEAALRRILRLWAEASEGSPELLDGAASEEAARELLDPPGTVLRGPRLLRVKPLRVRALLVPPEVTVQLDVRAYLGPANPDDDRPEGIVRKHRFWWRVARQDSEELPWQLVDAGVDPFRT
jgi:hypothetical protein